METPSTQSWGETGTLPSVPAQTLREAPGPGGDGLGHGWGGKESSDHAQRKWGDVENVHCGR